ncbi:MAG TPA: DUF6428 family protein [Chthoniobacterales bacterium]
MPHMTVDQLMSLLEETPKARPRFVLPDGALIPAHYHITEVGHLTRRFIDCGGAIHETAHACLLQAHVADDVEHRLDAATFAKILDLGKKVLPHGNIDVEVEYEDDGVSQYPIEGAELTGDFLELRLRGKHTDCLAKEKCGIESGCSTADCC